MVTNVEAEHLDFYPDAEHVEAAFVAFCRQASLVIACGDDEGASRVLRASGARAITYGEGPDNDVRIEYTAPEGRVGACRVVFDDEAVDVELALPGRHYLQNAAAALTAARAVGVPPSQGAEALAGFTGVRRRFERRGTARGADFVDDYAHHPTEIAATLAGARADRPGRIVAVFQPHRYSRTAALWRALGESLSAADLVVVTAVYGAGEMPIPGVTGKLLVDALLETSPRKRAVYLPSRSDIAPFLEREVRSGDLVLTLGAGDITMVGEEALGKMREADRAR